ncbi:MULTISPECIES: hypothetical protein [unclassified Psychrobacter]|uniref:hypothetical protein n=1 Tax=unclassified Psychrobacter TaxID=196806 RepID=UPI0018F41550|nr:MULTISPECIES: hypothetical protein [unclassified Psychrobacter]
MSETKKIADVLMQHLPFGAYDHSHNTVIYKDIIAHSKALELVKISSARIFAVLKGIPDALIDEFEREYGLPLLCGQSDVGNTVDDRRAEIERVKREGHVLLNIAGLHALFARYNQTVLSVQTYVPMQCLGPCVDPLNTDRLRFRVTLTLAKPIRADMACLSKHYLPASLRLDIK